MASTRMVFAAAFACVLVLCLTEVSAKRKGCPTICTQEYAPVCGRRADGSTMEFTNSCELGIHQCNNPGDIVSSTAGSCDGSAHHR